MSDSDFYDQEDDVTEAETTKFETSIDVEKTNDFYALRRYSRRLAKEVKAMQLQLEEATVAKAEYENRLKAEEHAKLFEDLGYSPKASELYLNTVPPGTPGRHSVAHIMKWAETYDIPRYK